MSRCVNDTRTHGTKLEGFSISKKLVELRAILLKAWAQVEDPCKDFLNELDIFANGNLATKLSLDVRGTGQVISMGVSLQNPFHFKVILLNEILSNEINS